MNQLPDEPLRKRLLDAQCAALNFLLLSSHSIGCLRVFASGLSGIKRRNGTIEPPLVAEAVTKATRCKESSTVLDGVYADAWSLLVDANRPPSGHPLAFQKVYEMAQALCASLGRMLPTTPEPDTADIVIAAARYQLCTREEATALWTTINQEFAIAGNKHGIRLAPIRHPEADTMAQVDEKIAPLLRDAHESWKEPTNTPDPADPPPPEAQSDATAQSDGATLSRVAKALCGEVDSIHQLRLGRTTSKPWKNELASQMPSDIVSLRKSLDVARDAISDLAYEEHSLKSGRLSTTFLARFDGDHAVATAALPKLIEEAHASHKQAAAASDARAHDQNCAQNSLIEGWLATHREQLRAMRDEFAQPYERQLVALTRLHNGTVEVDPWQETSHCGVLLKIVDATLKLLDSERSMDNFMESDRLSRSFAHLTATEWEHLEMSIRSEAARIGATPVAPDQPPTNDPRVAWHRASIAVLEDLDSVARALQQAPNMKHGLEEFDEMQRTGIDFEDVKAPWVTSIMTAASRMQSSLKVSRRVRKAHGGLCTTFRQSPNSTWGGMVGLSNHEALDHAANVVQAAAISTGNAKKADTTMREVVLRAAIDVVSIDRLRRALDREFELALLTPWEARCEDPQIVETNATAPDRVDTAPSFIRDGDLWHLTYDGKCATMPNRIGFRHLQHLLAHPHTDVHVTDLEKSGPVEAAGPQAAQSDEALARLKERRRLLAEHVDKSKANNDEGEHEKAAEELKQVDEQLANDLGISGTRAMPDAIAKLRSRVGKAMQAAMTAIRDQHPEAHHHLLASIRTPSGLSPSYRPKTPTTWLVNPTA